jgi:hypothetical protein
MSNRIRNVVVASAAAAAVIGSGVAAMAATGSPATASQVVQAATTTPNHIFTSCESKARVVEHLYDYVRTCPDGQTGYHWSAVGPKGATGKTGPSGVVSTGTTDLGPVASVATGGTFYTNATLVGKVNLAAGTYLVSVNAKATPNVSQAIEVLPEFFVYDQAANAAFTGDLFNVGSGALATDNTNIDSYYSGSGQITLTSATTLYVYAFGYDSDRSASTYTLDDLSVTATHVNTGP